MSDAFWSVRDLIRDRAFLLSAALSFGVVLIVGFSLGYLLSLNKIAVTPIAEISAEVSTSELHYQREIERNIKPLSGIFQLASVDFSNPRIDSETFSFKSQIWHGFLAELETFCQMSHDQINDHKVGVWIGGEFKVFGVDTIANVIVKTPDRVMAGIIKFGPKTCEIAKKTLMVVNKYMLYLTSLSKK
jgi:hypothetical protein